MQAVFISSVRLGFEAYREAVRSSVMSLKRKPVMFEDFGARPHSSETACLAEVENADIYVLILGPNYGSRVSNGLSPTHLEFRTAKKLGKPILAFVQNCEMDEEQKQFRAEVEDFKSGVFRAAFDSAVDLKDRVTEGLYQLEQTSKLASEEEFGQVVSYSRKQARLNDRADSPRLVGEFWAQPTRTVDITRIEAQIDERFIIACKAHLMDLKKGFESIEGDHWTGFRTKSALCVYFDNGLTIIEANAAGEEGASFFTSHLVSPGRLSQLLNGSPPLLDTHNAWCRVGLIGMQMATIGEPSRDGRQGGSIFMNNDEDSHFWTSKPFAPFTAGAFNEWCDIQIKLMARKFKK